MNRDNDINIKVPLQVALTSERMRAAILDEGKPGNYLPVVIVTNGYIPHDLDLMMFDQKVTLVENKLASELINNGHEYIDFSKARIKSDKVELNMVFNNAKITMKLHKEEDVWILISFYSKHKRRRVYEREF